MKQASQILIVDDNPQNLQMLGTTLRVNGYTPLFAKNGLQVFQMLKIKRPDLILLDIMMPDMNGFEVCEKLKLDTHTKDIPVIFLSAQFETDKIIEGFKLGAVDYVTKPFNTAELLSRVNTHLKLRTTEEQLKQALFNKDKFFSIIAHDLGNLFNGLIGLSEILVEHEPTQEETDKFLPMILQTSKKGHDLLFNLLEWSRVQTGQLKPVSQKIDLISLINLNLQFLHHQAVQKQINLISYVNTSVIFADERMLNTVIRNLISNAIKFTPQEGTVEISSIEHDTTIELVISDTGVGIEPENIKKLFKIEESYTTPGTANERGTGLGLNLCQEFVEINGGTIRVESEKGKGSQFYVRMPKTPTDITKQDEEEK